MSIEKEEVINSICMKINLDHEKMQTLKNLLWMELTWLLQLPFESC